MRSPWRSSSFLLLLLLALAILPQPTMTSYLNFCSSRQPRDINRIIGGRSATIAKWPWQALFFNFIGAGYGTMCGATVLNDEWLLTAAHCAGNVSASSYVNVGVASLSKARKTLKIRRVVVHPQFDVSTVRNDIALIQTATKIPLGSQVRAVCLARDDEQLLDAAKYGVVTGFGIFLAPLSSPSAQPIVDIFSLQTSDELRETSVKLIPTQQCTQTWQRLSGGQTRVTSKQLCAGSYMHGTAPGDSGGPLHVADPFGRFVQVGITSFGANGVEGIIDQETYPGVYTRVSPFIPWIQAVVGYEERYPSPNSASSLHCISILIVFSVSLHLARRLLL